ncbi:MAG: thiaminase II [Acidobacteriota bacterium]|nr:thiaminase II [Acidobacteriota bacterium]
MTAPREDRFTSRLWAGIDSIYRDILRHPFLDGLADGSLDRQVFRFYVLEDALYLHEFARAVATLGGKAPHPDITAALCGDAVATIEAEREQLGQFISELGGSRDELFVRQPAPTNRAYTSYFLSQVHSKPFHEGLAAILPCYWIYAEVGKELLKRPPSPDPLFRRWIESYGSEEYDAVVQRVVDLTDDVAEGLGPDARKAMAQHFAMSSRYEWMFWDMAWRQEAWPL